MWLDQCGSELVRNSYTEVEGTRVREQPEGAKAANVGLGVWA